MKVEEGKGGDKAAKLRREIVEDFQSKVP